MGNISRIWIGFESDGNSGKGLKRMKIVLGFGKGLGAICWVRSLFGRDGCHAGLSGAELELKDF